MDMALENDCRFPYQLRVFPGEIGFNPKYFDTFRGMDTLSMETTLSGLFFLPSEKCSILKELAPLGSKFFPFRIALFSEEA